MEGAIILGLLQHAARDADFLSRLGEYIALGATTIVTEEVSPLVGGLRARAGHLELPLVIAWVTGATWVSHVLLYFVGRWHAEWLTKRWPRTEQLVARVLGAVGRHPWRSSVAVRWAWGLRLTLPVACGAARVPLWLYVVGSGISAVTWSAAFSALGWGVGETALHVIGRLRRNEKWLVLAIVVVVAVIFMLMRRRHVEEEVVDVIDRDTRIHLPHLHMPGHPHGSAHSDPPETDEKRPSDGSG